MSEQMAPDGAAPGDDFGPLGKTLLSVSKATAIAGGLVFCALVVLSMFSIIGRKLWSMPVPGDVELLQMCAASATATYFAWCHLNHGDMKVDFFTLHAPVRVNHALDALGSGLYALIGGLLCWRAGLAAISIKEAGETSTLLAWPIWIPQALMVVPGFVLLTLAGMYMCAYHLQRATRGTAA